MIGLHSTATGGRLKHVPQRWRIAAGGAVLAIAVVAMFVGQTVQPAAMAQEALVIKALSEKRVTKLPAGPLVWRLETFATLAAARAAEGPLGIVAESTGQIWLFTLGPAGGASPGGVRVAEIGPVSIAPAAQYLLRINESSGPPRQRDDGA